jgi:hypothetical protein
VTSTGMFAREVRVIDCLRVLITAVVVAVDLWESAWVSEKSIDSNWRVNRRGPDNKNPGILIPNYSLINSATSEPWGS